MANNIWLGYARACVYLELVAPFQPTWQPSTVILGAGLATVAVVAAAVVHERVIGGQYQRATAWIPEKRPPTQVERRTTLTLPWRGSAVSIVSWIVAAVGFGTLVRIQEAPVLFAAEVDVTTVLGGLVTTALAYFLLERAVAPLVPMTLQNESPTHAASLGIRPRLILPGPWAPAYR